VARGARTPERRPTVVFRSDTGDLFTLNATGALIWRLLGEGRSLDAIGRRLAKRYGITPARAREDVFAFVAQARRHGIDPPR
jgi:hypothetical protein